ncbi:MAG: DUF6089 family protein [Bacteroidota bacterium]|jgi:hypothetical protein
MSLSFSTSAQYESFRHAGELGIQAGAAHYFGDLNTSTGLKRPHPAIGIFYRKQFNNYTAIRTALYYTQLSYSDKLQANNDFQRRRNLDFKTSIWEFSLMGDFNFFRFNPENPAERFTPFLTFGLGLFHYNPFTIYEGEKYFLRELGTEGQNSAKFPDKKEYGTMALCLPVGIGFKWALNKKVNLHMEITHRFTNTDFIDDVSGAYAGQDAFQPGSISAILQDRSFETGNPVGNEGAQRGFKANKDQYIIANIGITLNFSTYKCPGSF